MRTYFGWIAAICAALVMFAVGITLVGYKSLSVGRVATMLVLTVGAIGFAVASRRVR
ncbi:hypothetical protein [Adlercreutzia sp. ZJ138]|uniref:hypothetical protein n=1 Tax=Adlercreutzia sp. ZJ138 TaxID=2709405 RepID=UPI0013E9B031|nr:hypothetical protein [Adlercreutzia sp. ZJ138]